MFSDHLELAATLPNAPSSAVKVYTAKTETQWRFAFIAFVIGAVGLLPLKHVLDWLSGGPRPEGALFLAAAAAVFSFPIGVICIVNTLRGLPRLTVTPEGLKLEGGMRTRWTRWDNVGPFVLKTVYSGRSSTVRVASAKIVGPAASRGGLRARSFSIPDRFTVPIDAIVTELNAARVQATGDTTQAATGLDLKEASIGLAQFRVPWLTFALLAVLIVVFTLENTFAVTPGGKELAPSIATLLAFGALSHTAIFSNGEWYRLFTAPLLHASLAHILGNGIALLWGGWLLERLVGRLWFFAFFAIGALGGSLFSLAVNPVNLVAVGASGALMGMFAALFVGSFRYASGTASRQRLQLNSLRILIPSLLPLVPTLTVERIDYGAHVGGALSGTALALLLLKYWPESARIPQLRKAAAAISSIGVLLFVASGSLAIVNFPKYDVAIIPQWDLPKTPEARRTRAAALAVRYPNDPRSHLMLGQTLVEAKDSANAERELRLALDGAHAHSALFGSYLEVAVRSALAAVLLDQGKQDEAREMAQPACSALPGYANGDKLLKLLVAQHLCSQPAGN
jgi:membrane associated rhomboid family serine protease